MSSAGIRSRSVSAAGRIGASTVAFLALLGMAESAVAQTYPSRPITLVVPFAAGGPASSRSQ